jgi:Fe-S-cluster containining protein
MQIEINMDVPEAEFRKQVDNIINNARKNETVLPFPCHVGDKGIEIMALILSQIDCTGCDALCCKTLKIAEFGIPFLKTELEVLAKRIGDEKLAKMGIKTIEKNKYMPIPCPLLHKNTCSIYDIRPFVCIEYPISQTGEDNFGEKVVSLASSCPEARRITKRAYLTLWKLRNKMQEVVSQVDDVIEGARQEEILRSLKKTMAQEGKE